MQKKRTINKYGIEVVQVGIEWPVEKIVHLEKICAKNNLSRNTLIGMILNEFLSKHPIN